MTERLAPAALALVLLATLAGCSATNVPRLGQPGAAAGADEEVALFREADDFEKALEKKEVFVEDEAMQAYLDDMLARLLVGFDAREVPARIRVVNGMAMNAVMLGNGLALIDVGYLSLLDNGAQLAAILGHELEHHLDRHVLRRERERSNQKTRSLLLVSPFILLGLGDLGMMAADSISDSMNTRYSQDQERAADAAGLRAALAAGYDVRQAPAVFEAHLVYAKEEGLRDAPPNATHPPIRERLATMREQLAKLEAGHLSFEGTSTDRRGFETVMAPVELLAAEAYLRDHRIERARRAAARCLAVQPNNARAWMLRGHIEKRAAGSRSAGLDEAASAYARAAELDPAMGEAWRALGLVRRLQGRDADASRALRRYLAVSPEATDRAVVEQWLR